MTEVRMGVWRGCARSALYIGTDLQMIAGVALG